MQPIGNDGTNRNVVGNAAKDAAMFIRRCLGRRDLAGGVRTDMYCTTDGSSTLRTLDVAAQITSSTMSSTGTGASSGAEKATVRCFVGAIGRGRDGLAAAAALY